MDSDSDTAERETYNKAEINKKELKEKEEEVVTEKKSILESIMSKLQKWSGGEKSAPEKPTVNKSIKEQQEDYHRKLQEVMGERRREEEGKGKGKRFAKEGKTKETMDERDRRSVFIGGLSYVSETDWEKKDQMTRAIKHDLE